jgi:hypothetical protein
MADNPEAWEQLYGTQVAPRELTTQAKPTEAESIDALKQPTGSISDKGGTLADTGDSGSIKGVDKEREALRSGLGLDEDQAKAGDSPADLGDAQGASSSFEEGLTGKPSKCGGIQRGPVPGPVVRTRSRLSRVHGHIRETRRRLQVLRCLGLQEWHRRGGDERRSRLHRQDGEVHLGAEMTA